jgi:integrase/recombinase XerD
VEDVGHELPPANHFVARKKRRTPHIYTTDEISRLVEAALRLRPMRGLRPHTQATLIALLSSTGLRISEALKLSIADVTRDDLLIRETKFRKTRLVPLHDTAAAGLQRYLACREPGSGDDPLFIDKRNRPLRYIAVKETFGRLVDKAGIRSTSARHPRLHDLRHTFAVRALQGSPTGRGRCGAHMAALATYMGHVNIYALPDTSRSRPTSCAMSPRLAKRLCRKGGHHDADRSPRCCATHSLASGAPAGTRWTPMPRASSCYSCSPPTGSRSNHRR